MGFGKNNTGAILRSTETIALSTLAGNTAILFGSGITTVDAFRMLKSEVAAFVEGLTGGEGTGLLIGLAEGSLTVAQITACLVADGPVGRGDRDDQELAERWVRIFGQLLPAAGSNDGAFIGKNGDAILEVKPRWTFSESEGWNFFIFNAGGIALQTGATARAVITTYGVWVD